MFVIPERLRRYSNQVRGTTAGAPTVSVDTPLASCQRPLDTRRLAQYIETAQGFDWNLFGHCTVSRDHQGRLAIIDGQHRIALARGFFPDLQQVPAHIIDIPEGFDHEVYESLLFTWLNGEATRRVNNEEMLFARVIAEDPSALQALRVLQRSHIRCGRVNADPDIPRPDVRAATLEKCIALSESVTELAIDLQQRANQVWRRVNIDNKLLHALVYLMTRPEYQELQRQDSTLGQDFHQFITEILPAVRSKSDAGYNQYRNASAWEIGIAYGLLKDFRNQQVVRRGPTPRMEPMRQLYERSVTARSHRN